VGTVTACNGPKPFVREGEADRVEIGYSGDVATAVPVARQYCARFGRSARLAEPGLDIALFDCVPP
jgi:hypothetical protein